MPVSPFKEKSILVIYSNAVLALTMVVIFLKVVARYCRQIAQTCSIVQHCKFSFCNPSRGILSFTSLENLFRFRVRKTFDHGLNINAAVY